ncbi:MAG: DUF362 domain-containing protein [Ignavibacteria bacterium]|nr:DUF362 domain-containing protein [Ignavibacteria bacterium]
MSRFLKTPSVIILLLIVFFGISAFYYKSNDSKKAANTNVLKNSDKPIVYMTKDISSDGLIAVYKKLGRKLPGKVAVKISTGEPGGENYLSPDLIKELVQNVNGTIVECNTAYKGQRSSTEQHKKVAEDHGFTAIAPVDIMDEEGSISLPFEKGVNIKEDFVGSHFKNYDSYIILSHFKGHRMGGFGGAMKNMSIGIASANGKMWIHTAGVTDNTSDFTKAFVTPQDKFLESMAEAAGAVMSYLGDNILFISVMNKLSVDCDCSSNPAAPTMKDIGILASLDPVALDQACVDWIYKVLDGHDLIKRMEEKNGVHTLEYAEKLGLGSRSYELVIID